MIDNKSKKDRYDHNFDDGYEHAYYVNIYSLSGIQLGQKRSQERCKDSGYRSHTNGQCHITFGQVCHNVGRGSSRAGTYQDHTNGQLRT